MVSGHKAEDMLRQRVYALALGYEDLNDHAALRKDTAIQTAVGNDKDPASSATLCRLENSADRRLCWETNKVFVEVFIESFKKPPRKDFFRSSCGNIRIKLFKIGTIVLRNTRRVQMLLSSAYPYQKIFYQVARRLEAT